MHAQQPQRAARRGGAGAAAGGPPALPRALLPIPRRATAVAAAAFTTTLAVTTTSPAISSSSDPILPARHQKRQQRRRPVAMRATAPNAAEQDAAESSSSPSAPRLSGANVGVEVAIPQSQGEALRDAVAALRAVAPSLAAAAPGGGSLSASGKRAARAKKGAQTKGFGGGGGDGAAPPSSGAAAASASGANRYAIELPVADTGPAACAALADAVLARLAPVGGAVVVFADDEAAAAAASGGGSPGPLRRASLSLREACRAASLPDAAMLLIVAPAVADVALVEQLLDEVWAPASSSSSSSSSCSSPPALVLNPGWAERGGPAVPREYERLVGSFDVAYSFCPVAISGLVRGRQGAVLLDRGGGGGGDKAGGKPQKPRGGAAASWRILCESSNEGRFVQIGQARSRPSDDDIQAAFLNASAAASPLTKAVKAARGLFDRGGGKERA